MGVVSTQFGLLVPHGKLKRCIASFEDGLRSIKRTGYHRALGRDFLGQVSEMANWISDFARKADAANVGLSALYLELNGFAINPDQWHCHLFGYKTAGSVWELDWLSKWDAEHGEFFVLRGMEPVQHAFAELYVGDQPLSVELAAEVTEHLVTARFMELVAAAHKVAKRRFRKLANFPILATAHDWNVVHKTT